MTLQIFQKFEWIALLSLVIQFAGLSLFLFYSRENALLSIHMTFNGLFVCTQISRKKKYPPIMLVFPELQVLDGFVLIIFQVLLTLTNT